MGDLTSRLKLRRLFAYASRVRIVGVPSPPLKLIHAVVAHVLLACDGRDVSECRTVHPTESMMWRNAPNGLIRCLPSVPPHDFSPLSRRRLRLRQ